MERSPHSATVAGLSPPITKEAFRLGAVILAAGRSLRMGRPKLLLPWGETSVLGHLLNQWRQVGAAQVAVVHAADNRLILAERGYFRIGYGSMAVPSHHRLAPVNLKMAKCRCGVFGGALPDVPT